MLTAVDIVRSLADVPFAKYHGVDEALIDEFLPYGRNYADGLKERFDARFSVKPIRTWICTDTEVGFYAMFFDGEFVGFANQPYRKSNMDFGWVSVEHGTKVRNFVIELFSPDAEGYDFSTFPLDEDFEDHIKHCNEQIAESEAYRAKERAWFEKQRLKSNVQNQ